MTYKSVPIPTLVPQKRKPKSVPIIHPGVVRKPLHWQRYRPVVQLVPARELTHVPFMIRKVG